MLSSSPNPIFHPQRASLESEMHKKWSLFKISSSGTLKQRFLLNFKCKTFFLLSINKKAMKIESENFSLHRNFLLLFHFVLNGAQKIPPSHHNEIHKSFNSILGTFLIVVQSRNFSFVVALHQKAFS